MDRIKYYDFESKLGKMLISFSDKGIVYLSLAEDRENMLKYINKKYGQAIRVNKSDYSYHHELIEYTLGNLKKFSLPLDLRGTEFQMRVWKELLNIPYGETRTYKDIAIKIGRPKAYRAVGNALNKNPILIVVPCHRVIGSNGDLVGFGGGLDLKKRLLEIERKNLDFMSQ